jgi:hypothetical protein
MSKKYKEKHKLKSIIEVVSGYFEPSKKIKIKNHPNKNVNISKNSKLNEDSLDTKDEIQTINNPSNQPHIPVMLGEVMSFVARAFSEFCKKNINKNTNGNKALSNSKDLLHNLFMEKNFRNFAESLSNEERTLFNINEYRNPEITTKFNQERGYVGGLILNLKQQGFFVIADLTFGYGGYSKKFLEYDEKIAVIAFDKDQSVLQRALEIEAEFCNNQQLSEQNLKRFIFINDSFANISNYLPQNSLDVIVGDFGVSSMQLDQAHRGFSFLKEADLDMRMNINQSYKAFDFVNKESEENIADIIFEFGGERKAKKIAEQICNARQKQPIKTTTELASIVSDCYGSFSNKIKIGRAHV